MRRVAVSILAIATISLASSPAHSEPGAFVGVDVGFSEPINGNYRAHVHGGGTFNPYAGYMFHDNIGMQGQLHVTAHAPDSDGRGIPREKTTTSLIAFTAGPRFSLPMWEPGLPFLRAVEIYATGQGGVVTGTSGRLTQTDWAISAGGGIDFYLTDHLAVSGFARWNRLFTSPRPTFLPTDVVEQSPGEQGPRGAEYATMGIGLKYDFREPPIPPPLPPCPACPVHKKIVLRSVYFDFDQSDFSPDAIPVIEQAIDVLKSEDGEFSIVLEGHTDSVGSESYNQVLSERRAESVRQYMLKQGVDPAKIRSIGYGESRPAATNRTQEGRAKNRRVDQRLGIELNPDDPVELEPAK